MLDESFIVHVDDAVITSDDTNGIGNLKFSLEAQFHTKHLGNVQLFLKD